MTAKTILAFLFLLTLRTAAQEAPEPQRQAQCNFSDGRTITVTYFSERREYRLATDEDLVTVKGIGVPSGDYSVFPAKDSHNNWTLRMRKQTEKGRSSELPPLPMSVTTSAPVANFTVSFDHTGGSCVMHWGAEKFKILLSLEFTERNTDLPVFK